MKKDKLEEDIEALEGQIRSGVQFVGGADSRLLIGTTLLGKAILRLDRTSSRLAWINIALAVIVVVIGIFQVILMVKGH